MAAFIIFIALVIAVGFFPAIWLIIYTVFWIAVVGFVGYVAIVVLGGLVVGLNSLFSGNKGERKKAVDERKQFEFKSISPPSTHYNSCEYYASRDYKPADEEIKDLMQNHGLGQDEAEHVKEIMDENDLDEDEAVELKDDL